MGTPLDHRIEKYVDGLFDGVGPSQELFDLKEELTTNLREKTADLRARGLDEEEAFREAVVSMGDLSGLVDDVRRIGRDRAKQAVYSSLNARISAAGIVLGTLLILFGLFNIGLLYAMRLPGESVAGTGIFAVVGGALLTFSVLIRETRRRYGMARNRAALYALSVGSILFGLFVGTVSRFSTGELYVGIAAAMFFVMAGTGLFLYLALTESDRSKE